MHFSPKSEQSLTCRHIKKQEQTSIFSKSSTSGKFGVLSDMLWEFFSSPSSFSSCYVLGYELKACQVGTFWKKKETEYVFEVIYLWEILYCVRYVVGGFLPFLHVTF